MISVEMGNKDLVYYNGDGDPRLRKCVYCMSDGVQTLAYPPQFCDAHTSSTYPKHDRLLWQASTLKVRTDNLCLGNEGTLLIYYPDGCGSWIEYDEDSETFTDGLSATCVKVPNGGVAMSLAGRADNAYMGYFVANPYVRYRNGSVGYTSTNDPVYADDFVIQRPDFTGVTIPDEFGYGQYSGSFSYPWVSGKVLVEIPSNFGLINDTNLYVRMLIADNAPNDHRPSRTFNDVLADCSTHCRIAKNWTADGRRFILFDILDKSGPVGGSYSHVFTPYVFFHDTKQEKTSMVYKIHDMALSIRLVDTIRGYAT